MKVGAWTNSTMLNFVVFVLLSTENDLLEQIWFNKTKLSAQTELLLTLINSK